MVQGPSFHAWNLGGKKLKCMVFWLGPQKIDVKCMKVLNEDTLNQDSATYMDFCGILLPTCEGENCSFLNWISTGHVPLPGWHKIVWQRLKSSIQAIRSSTVTWEGPVLYSLGNHISATLSWVIKHKWHTVTIKIHTLTYMMVVTTKILW
jgi:hypothetical protein